MEKMDVIITTVCRPHLRRTLNSFFESVTYSGKFNFIVNVDLKNPKYLQRMMKYLRVLNISDVNINRNPGEFDVAHTAAINYLYDRVKSPIFFHLQDDWLFLEKIDLDPLVRVMEEHPRVDHIRFSKEQIPSREWLYHLSERPSEEFMTDHHNTSIDGVPLVQAHTWSFNPSLARASVAKGFTGIPLGTRAETYICHEYDERVAHNGCYLYGQIGDSAAVKDIGRSRYKKLTKKIGTLLRKSIGSIDIPVK